MAFVHLISNDFSESIASIELKTLFAALLFLLTIILLFLSYFANKKPFRKVYLLDFSCYKPPSTLMCSKQRALDVLRNHLPNFTEESGEFMKKAMYKAGMGDSTYVSEAMLREPFDPSMEDSREEAEMVMFGAIDELLAKTNVACDKIEILIVNCSIFNVVPSLSDMIVHRYKLKDNIATYNLTGMGCSAGLIAIGLANQLLQVQHETYALVVSTENISQNAYLGNDRSKMAINCLFRLGAAAILLSNRSSDNNSSKYQLIQTIHINHSSSDISYKAIFQEEDKEGIIGISLSKNIINVAKTSLESNLTMLAPLILPLSEKFNFLKHSLVKRFDQLKRGRAFHNSESTSKVSRYVPKFSKCVDHFFPHVGGKPLLDELQKVLGFSDTTMEAPRMTLNRFGNTSSSSVWYEIAYSEAKGRIKKGDSLWQIAFGSGFMSSSLIWKALRTIDIEEMNPWMVEIDQFPVNLDGIGSVDDELFYLEKSKQA